MYDFFGNCHPHVLNLRVTQNKISIKILIILCTILLFTVISDQAKAAENIVKKKGTIVFSTIFTEDLNGFKKLNSIYTEAFRRLGFNFILENYPGERALIEADKGAVDGEAARISSINDKKAYPNLVQVEEWVLKVDDGVYAVDKSIHLNGYPNLANTNYIVGLFKGIKSVEKQIHLYVNKDNTVVIAGLKQALDMLLAGRIDLFVVSTEIENTALYKQPEYKDIRRAGLMETKYLNAFMHKKHKDLSLKLADVLKQIKQEESFKK